MICMKRTKEKYTWVGPKRRGAVGNESIRMLQLDLLWVSGGLFCAPVTSSTPLQSLYINVWGNLVLSTVWGIYSRVLWHRYVWSDGRPKLKNVLNAVRRFCNIMKNVYRKALRRHVPGKGGGRYLRVWTFSSFRGFPLFSGIVPDSLNYWLAELRKQVDIML